MLPPDLIAAAFLLLRAIMQIVGAVPDDPRTVCVDRRMDSIIEGAVAASTAHDVPVGLLLTVGWVESHLGCAVHSGGSWGAPISPTNRHVAGGPSHAARALHSGFAACGSWSGAVGRFRSGLCRPTDRGHQHYVDVAMRVWQRSEAAVGTVVVR